ncbi:MAG: N-6 DNA methylase [Chthonomonadaceae bacterium]|nr:N-6 DNA methylase [Chthonomonadaceae bacterium]
MSKLSEQRARAVTRDLLSFRGWDVRPVSSGGQLLEETEYRAYPSLIDVFKGQSKTGPGDGKPDFLLVESSDSLKPLIVIDTKPSRKDIDKSVKDTTHYGDALFDAHSSVLSVAVAGAEKELCDVRVLRRIDENWAALTLHNTIIDWIPSPAQTSKIISLPGLLEVAPEQPPIEVLAEQAARMNEILREAKIKDEYRPNFAATLMLALWHGDVSTDPSVVLEQINANAAAALKKAGKPGMAQSLRVEEGNTKLAEKAWQIIDILKKLNIRSFLQEHDYLGQLYETFFRYTGGNTIGQYFTPRHIIDMMCDLTDVSPGDVVFDPACGTGGFLVGALRRMVSLNKGNPYEDTVKNVRDNLFGLEDEPTTAALCITNMILRGDGKSGIVQADCFKKKDFPPKEVDVSLLNPPFPHKKTDIHPTAFIDRALSSVKQKGLVASVVPYSTLIKVGDWHKKLLKNNQLVFVATMPDDLFSPYASLNTAVLVIRKGVPQGNSKVFFARLRNDGHKLKKTVRVEQAGSQIGPILEAFESKKDIPELTVFHEVTGSTAEWAPEAFIASAARVDKDFLKGLEQKVRNQGAFLVANGHKLLASADSVKIEAPNVFNDATELSLDKVTMGGFRLADYFDIKLGGKDEIEDLPDGSYPIVSTSEFNNGVTNWKGADRLYAPPAISVATDGSTASSFVQEFPFYAFYKVAILTPKRGVAVPVDAMYYVSYLINLERWRYVYARKFGKGRLLTTTLIGPVKNGKPDFEKMAEIVSKCAAYPVVASFRKAYRAHVTKEVARLAVEWKQTRSLAGSLAVQCDNPAYKAIVSLGGAAVPALLKLLETDPGHWFPALHAITGENPVPTESEGKLKEMAKAWTQWAKDNGHTP